MVSVAILGAGFMASARVPGYRALGERARVARVCARSARGRRLADRLGAAYGTDIDEAILDPGVDAVDICLPTPLHSGVAERALRAGKHVLVEKPISLTLEDAEAMAATARDEGRLLMVGHVLRFSADYVEMARLVHAREFGSPLSASAYRLSPTPDWNDWMGDPGQSGGTVVDLMIHDFDQLNWLFGAPRRVHAAARADDPTGFVAALVDYDGAQAVVEGSLALPASYPFRAGIRVVCENGVLEHGVQAGPAAEGGNIGGTVERFLRVHPADGRMRELPIESADPWAAELDEFVGCIEHARPVTRGTPQQGIEALRLALTAARSLATGHQVDVDAMTTRERSA